MAFITADRVLDSSTSTGTGAFVVSGTPAAGYRTFSAVMSVGDTCYYSIQGQTTSEWEVGLGTYSSANTLTRTTVYSSSNAGSAVTFSAGTKNVFITMVASKSPQLDPTGNVTALGTPASATLTNATGLSLTTGVTGILPPANGGSLSWQSVQSGNFTAVAGNAYPVNTTSGAVTATLPAGPTAGQIVQFTDYAGTWGVKSVVVSPNGNKINGETSYVFLATNRETVAFVYLDATQGWLAYSGFNASTPISTYTASYLIVAGGGGGGGGAVDSTGAGGGAGGLLSGTTTFSAGTTYTATVGAGGSGGANSSANTPGTQGSNSSFTGLTTTIGGGAAAAGLSAGGAGGSGGGGNLGGAGGSGTSGQGNAGGSGTLSAPNYGSGGGGGASAVGSNGTSTSGGNGGAGTASSITGSSVTYAGGGGGGTDRGGTVGLGGSGGGGNAGASNGGNGNAGTANTGGGGGGGSFSGTVAATGGTGGSGVIILSVPTVYYSGTTTGSPTITTSGSNTIIKFTASGSYTA